MSENIENKVVVITGGSSGLGEAMARHLAKLGAKVVLGARREDNLKKIVADIQSEGGEAAYAVCDVTVREDVDALVQKAISSFGGLDVMVNNAGLMAIAPVSALRVEEWDRMIDINVKGVLYGVAAALPIFREQKSGHIINISSTAGLKVFRGGAVYCGTKFAVRAIGEGVRMEAGKDVRVTTIEPGMVDTELVQGTTHSKSASAMGDMYGAVAIGADSIARAVAYAIEQPSDVDVNEMVIRPTAQEM
ncbi:MAG: SDR family oxidoreductase [Parvularculaceae bacterium]|nr:SDR family oxidoreductase [Parvularculaceae bacterium]